VEDVEVANARDEIKKSGYRFPRGRLLKVAT
jgi:hypothetical protein